MIRPICTLAALALVLAAAPAAVATQPPVKKPMPAQFPVPAVKAYTPKPVVFPQVYPAYAVKNYHLVYGTKFAHRYFYKGFHHTHWTRVFFSPFYGCRVFWCPFTMAAYYWCQPDLCFYPVNYCPYGQYDFGPPSVLDGFQE